MLSPCFAAMMEGAVMAINPPDGLNAVPNNTTANASANINAILNAFPLANGTRNVYFMRPTTLSSTYYKINARLDITKDGTAVICGGANRIQHANLTGRSLTDAGSENPWFRGSGLSPHIRIVNAEHVQWHGGSLRGRDIEGGGTSTQTAFEVLSCRFTVISLFL